MTSTTGTDEHPEVAEISALFEGVLPSARSADVRGHLAGCVPCTDVQTSLSEIRALLGTLPGPPSMPFDVADRIDAALAAEAPLNGTVPSRTVPYARESPGDTSPGTASSESATRGSTVPREAESSPVRRPGGRPSTVSGPGRARTRRRWSRALLTTACAGAALVLGGVVVQNIGTDDPETAMDTGTVASAPRTDLSPLVRELLKSAESTGVDTFDSPVPGTGTARSPLRTTAGTVVPPCVIAGIGRTETPLAAGLGNYTGPDSYLVVLQHVGDPALVDAYVVDASCTSAPGDVLLEETHGR